MKLIISKLIFFFLLIGFSEANENIKFVDVNFIVNNSIIGKSLKDMVFR